MSNVTISQALRQIKKHKGELAEVLLRAHTSVSYAIGREPAFEYGACVEEADGIRMKLLLLKEAVAVANATTRVEYHGAPITIAGAIGVLSELKSQIAWLKLLPVKSREETVSEDTDYDIDSGKHVKTKTQWRCSFPEAKRAALVRTVQGEFDKLNDLVETENHKTVIKVPS